MTDVEPNVPDGGIRDAARFWEPRRIWYNLILITVVLLWVAFTWPHFRSAMNLDALGRMTVLALLANVCYCAAYVAEIFIQPLLPQASWKRSRLALWIVGMLFALVLANYWIADEIYPDFPQRDAVLSLTQPSISATNMNFPAPIAVVGFLAASGGFFIACAALLIFWFARKPRFARRAATAIGIGSVIYLGLLLGYSAASHDVSLARGQEKYFCEIDCHLAYAIVDVKTRTDAEATDYIVTLRTRFDETTISAHRPKDALLRPSRREVRLIDGSGRAQPPRSTAGSSLLTPLIPGQSYTTQLEFRIPKSAGDLRLLLNTTPGWPDHFVIGDENSWLHKKTYFAL